MLARLIVLVLIGAIVVMVVRRLKVATSAPRRRATIETATVRCAQCQVYLPSNEAIVRGGKHYCSSHHAEQAHRPT